MNACLFCGVEVPPRRKFCSKLHYGAYLTKEENKIATPKFCANCGGEIKRRWNEGIKRWNSRTLCGRQCMVGQHASNWRGGRREQKGYYTRLSIATNRRVFEHRVIAEKMIGRPLAKNEVVHHINCDKTDNRPENLQVVTRGEHKRIHDEMGRLYAQEHFGSVPSTADIIMGLGC